MLLLKFGRFKMDNEARTKCFAMHAILVLQLIVVLSLFFSCLSSNYAARAYLISTIDTHLDPFEFGTPAYLSKGHPDTKGIFLAGQGGKETAIIDDDPQSSS